MTVEGFSAAVCATEPDEREARWSEQVRMVSIYGISHKVTNLRGQFLT